MNSKMLAALAGSVAVIGAVVFFLVEQNQSHALHLQGEIVSIRFNTLSDGGNLSIIHLKVTNPSSTGYEVRGVEVDAISPDGKETIPSGVLSKREVRAYTEFEKLDGTPIGLGDEVKKGETIDRIMSARFEVPRQKLAGYTLRVKFTSVNGVPAEITGRIP
ncbi:MAG: hypothetical protein WDO18_20335 [Acidobacteriota bacterium]